MSFIEVKNLHHTYTLRSDETVRALNGIDLSIEPGEYVAIVGSNGSGKTTLALHLNGILTPNEGSVWVDGHSTTDLSAVREVRSEVGMVFQSPEDQIVATVVEEDVAFGPENLGVRADLLEERIRESLDRVGMWDERHRPPHQLSAGQKQRVAIAGALAMHPRCLVLDEATSMLDPAGAAAILDIIEGLNSEGMAVITVTHKMEEAARARRVVVLHNGKLVADATPTEVFSNPRLNDWRLRAPAVSVLADRLRPQLTWLPAGIFRADDLAAVLSQGAPE